MKVLDKFVGKHHYLSNFHHSPMEFDGLSFLNAEAAFHSQKTTDREIKKQFVGLPPNKAKALGRKVLLRSDWEEVKEEVMYQVVKSKFSQNEEMGRKLVGTKDAYLEEGNTWHDTCWGVCQYTGEGENKLGEILMRVRRELQ